MDKAQLRKQLLEQRMALTDRAWQKASLELVEQIKLWLRGRSFDHMILYRSFRREPDLTSLARFLQPNACYYPKLIQQELAFFSADVDEDFQKNSWGLEEPLAKSRPALLVSPKTLLIIPGVAYDQQLFRLGYGGGYFDRFLSRHQPTTVGVCFDAFVVDRLPRQSHDLPVQHLITESRFL